MAKAESKWRHQPEARAASTASSARALTASIDVETNCRAPSCAANTPTPKWSASTPAKQKKSPASMLSLPLKMPRRAPWPQLHRPQILARGKVRFMGDPVAAVAAETAGHRQASEKNLSRLRAAAGGIDPE